MKKLTKFLSYSAIIASAVFIVSCSDDVVDSNTTKDSGIPFRVNASVNNSGTRASDITTLKNFQIWGFTGDATNELAGVNCTLASGGGYVPATTVNWPDANTSYTFYAVSNNTKTLSSNISNNDIAGSSHSFDYTMPYTVVDGKNVVTIASQEDLLAAAASGKSTTGVTLPFDHILSAGNIHLKLTPSNTYHGQSTTTHYMFAIKINKITIHNVYISGTYNAVTNLWNTSSGVLGDYVIDFSDNPLLIQTPYNVNVDLPITTSNLMFIPQTVSYWDIKPNTEGTDLSIPGTNANLSYVEIEANSLVYEYEALRNELQDLVKAGGIVTNANGDFVENDNNYPNDKGKVIAKSTGEIVNFSVGRLNDWTLRAYPSVESYSELSDAKGQHSGIFSDLDAEDYGILYKPFKATLGVNGNRIFSLELTTGVRKIDTAGCFGKGVEGVGA